MRLTVTISRDEDGVYVVECPAIPGCISQGRTKDEALENIKDAIKLCLEVRAERVIGQGTPSSDLLNRQLREAMDELGREAESRGLTPEVLDQILKEDDLD